MGAQQGTGIEVEGIVHGAGRVVPGNIQGLEVVVIVFDLGPLLHAVTGAGKNLFNTLQGAGYRVQATQVLATAWQGNINGFAGQPGFDGRLLEIRTAGIDSLFNLPLGFVDLLTGRRAFLCRELAQGLCLLGNYALLAEVFHANLIKCLKVVCLFNGVQPVLNQLLQVFH